MHHTTTASPWKTTLLLVTSASISGLSYAGDATDILEVTLARGWASTDSHAKETINLTLDECTSDLGVGSFDEMPLESTCSVWVDTPGDDFEELASWAGAESYAGVLGWEPNMGDGHSGFVVFNSIQSWISTDPDSNASAYSWTRNSVDFTLSERAHMAIESCFETAELSSSFLQIKNSDTLEIEYSFAVNGFLYECQTFEIELPAGNYTLHTQLQGEHSGAGELELMADMGAGISARALTPAERADINRDGFVDGADLLKLLAYWGSDIEMVDINQDGTVNGGDITMLFAYWS